MTKYDKNILRVLSAVFGGVLVFGVSPVLGQEAAAASQISAGDTGWILHLVGVGVSHDHTRPSLVLWRNGSKQKCVEYNHAQLFPQYVWLVSCGFFGGIALPLAPTSVAWSGD